jgi:hypothetical protein
MQWQNLKAGPPKGLGSTGIPKGSETSAACRRILQELKGSAGDPGRSRKIQEDPGRSQRRKKIS